MPKYSVVIPNVKETLGILKKRNYKLAIASNRPEKFSRMLINHLGLRKYFAAVACANNKDEIKPHPRLLLKIIKKLGIKKNEVIYLGDMTIDVRAGKNAGIRTIAVVGGSSSRNELKKVDTGLHEILRKRFLLNRVFSEIDLEKHRKAVLGVIEALEMFGETE